MTDSEKRFRYVEVVSRNFVVDFVAKIQNLLGNNLTGYEKMIDKGLMRIEQRMKADGVVPSFYRYQITELSNGAIAILMYGSLVEQVKT